MPGEAEQSKYAKKLLEIASEKANLRRGERLHA